MVIRSLNSSRYLRTSFHHYSRRLFGDTLHLTKEETGVRRLVIAYRLPRHGITIFMVGPQSGDTPRGRITRSLNDQFIAGTSNNLLTPVTKDIAQETGIVL